MFFVFSLRHASSGPFSHSLPAALIPFQPPRPLHLQSSQPKKVNIDFSSVLQSSSVYYPIRYLEQDLEFFCRPLANFWLLTALYQRIKIVCFCIVQQLSVALKLIYNTYIFEKPSKCQHEIGL